MGTVHHAWLLSRIFRKQFYITLISYSILLTGCYLVFSYINLEASTRQQKGIIGNYLCVSTMTTRLQEVKKSKIKPSNDLELHLLRIDCISGARYNVIHVATVESTENIDTCNETFNDTFEDNLKIIQNYPGGSAGMYLKQLNVNNVEPKQQRLFPVFVTAFDSSHYNESQGLFQCLHNNFLYNPKYKNDVLIVAYDMGLTAQQASMVKIYCKCELRKFKFEQFPLHVRTLTTYAFKPIIVQEMLMEFRFVWWVDTSIRFTTNNIDPQIAYAKEKGVLYTVSRNFATKGTLTKNTLNATFEYLQEDRCKFRPFHEVWATTLLFNFDQISSAIVKAWATCALNKDCIAPDGSENKRGCNLQNDYDGRCHRFDQSAIGIITRRLFHDEDYPINKNLTLIYTINRDETVNYFK